MSSGEIFLIVVSGLGVIHGLFLAVFLWSYSKGNPTSNNILSLLLMVLSFRVGKSVFLEFSAHLDVKFIFIGLGTLMAIGPLFYLFNISLANKAFRLNIESLTHFIPSACGIAIGLWLNEELLNSLPLLFFVVLFLSYYSHYLVYLIISLTYVTRRFKAGDISNEAYTFSRLLFYGLLVIWIAYVLNLFDDEIPYVIGPVLYSVVAYVISFIVIQKGYIQKTDYSKYKTTPISDDQMNQIFEKVNRLVVSDKQYRNESLTLKGLSESINVSTQILSLVINQKSEMNFNSFINHFRVEEALTLFNEESYQNRTIASIALDVGFSSISSFNTSFKKETGKTPLAYRKHLIK